MRTRSALPYHSWQLVVLIELWEVVDSEACFSCLMGGPRRTMGVTLVRSSEWS